MSTTHQDPHSSYVQSSQMRHLRACMVCSLLQLTSKFISQGCPNCEGFLALQGSDERVRECTSQVYEGMITLTNPSKSWVAKWNRLDGYVPGVYATKVTGVLPEEVVQDIEDAGVKYIPRDGSAQEEEAPVPNGQSGSIASSSRGNEANSNASTLANTENPPVSTKAKKDSASSEDEIADEEISDTTTPTVTQSDIPEELSDAEDFIPPSPRITGRRKAKQRTGRRPRDTFCKTKPNAPFA